MPDGLILVIVVAASYLAARLAFDWLASRFIVVSGAEYLLLGILLGPQVSGLVSPETVDSFAPLVSLALGWMGALFGSRLLLPALVRTPSATLRVAFVESVLTLAVVAGLCTLGIHVLLGMPVPQALVPGVALGAIGTVSAQEGVAVISRNFANRSAVIRQLQVGSGMNVLVGIVVSGLLLALVHPTPEGLPRPITETEWVVITLAIGAVGGTLFHLFLAEERKSDRLFIALAGGVVLVSGAATYLRLSPVLAAMIFGLVLANTTRARREIVATLERVERPLYFALLIFGGAVWHPSDQPWLLPVVVFLVTRTAAKIGAARLSARFNAMLPTIGPDWGRGLLGQGGIALALALSYMYQETLPLPNVVFTAAVASLLLTDLLSARFVRSIVPTEIGPFQEETAPGIRAADRPPSPELRA